MRLGYSWKKSTLLVCKATEPSYSACLAITNSSDHYCERSMELHGAWQGKVLYAYQDFGARDLGMDISDEWTTPDLVQEDGTDGSQKHRDVHAHHLHK